MSSNCFFNTAFSSVKINKELYTLVDEYFLPGASVDFILWMGRQQHGKRSLHSIKKPVPYEEASCDDEEFLGSIHFVN